MVRLYCKHHHPSADPPCPECAELLDYALERLSRCPFQEGKTTCARCPVHCYRADKRARIRQVMRYAGPRMLTRHPLLALRHLIDGLRKEPVSARQTGEPRR
jgi:hypothetical protein